MRLQWPFPPCAPPPSPSSSLFFLCIPLPPSPTPRLPQIVLSSCGGGCALGGCRVWVSTSLMRGMEREPGHVRGPGSGASWRCAGLHYQREKQYLTIMNAQTRNSNSKQQQQQQEVALPMVELVQGGLTIP